MTEVGSLPAIRLSSRGNMALEDFTTYEEVDTVNDRIQKTANHIDFVSSRNAEETYLYKDYGVDHFGDFTHKVDEKQTAGSWVGHVWGLANGVDEILDLDPVISVQFYYAGGSNSVIVLRESYDSSDYTHSTANGTLDLNTPYYFLIKKTGTALKCGIYSTANLRDAGDATDGDIDNLALTLQADHKFRYIYGCSSHTLTSVETGTFEIDNLDLQEGGQDYPIETTCGLSLDSSISRSIAIGRATSSSLSLASSLNRILGIVRATTSNLTLNSSHAVETIRPNAAGDETNIPEQYPDSGEHWAKVDEASPDENNSYVKQDSLEWDRDLYNLPAHSGSGTINKVTLYFRVSAAGSVGRVKGVIKSNSTVTETAQKDPYGDFGATTWGTYSQEWATNPADDEPWEWSDIDALQIGVALYCQNTRCTQLYVEVDYNVDSISRTVAYGRASSSNLSLATTISRVVAFARATSSSLSLAVSMVKSWGRTITTSVNLSLTPTISRAVAWARATSSNLSLAAEIVVTGIQNYLIELVVNLSLATSITRTLAFARSITTNLSLTTTLSRVRNRTISTIANLSLTTTVSRAIAWTRTTSSSLSLTATVARLSTWARSTTSNLSLTATVSRVIAWGRSTTSNLSLLAHIAGVGIEEYLIELVVNLSLSTSVTRTLAIAKNITTNLSLATTVNRIAAFVKTVTTNLSLATSLSKAVTYVRSITSTLNLSTTISRVATFARATTSSLSLTATISRLVGWERATTVLLDLTATITSDWYRLQRFAIKVMTTQYRNISVKTSQYRAIKALTAQYRKIKILLLGE